MKTITKIRILNQLGLFNKARTFYYWYKDKNPKIKEFYSHFISKDDLCFDIGANIGRKIDIFLKLTSKIVAVEPQEECFKYLHKRYRKKKDVVIIQKALSFKQGYEDMHICEANSLSSLSKEWVNEFGQTSRYRDFKWVNKIKVETTTLDQLIQEYGVPKYCKIDTEGFEFDVLKGLTQPLPYLSFEIFPENKNIVNCISYLSEISPLSFNFLHEGKNKFKFGQWLTAIEMIDFVKKSRETLFGEIFCRSFNMTQASDNMPGNDAGVSAH